ncbi:MAG TPA: hypothetical protein ENI86_14825 [Acidimicrobiales bacterium]|nr:hypothetical protein [Acidimicrobiales bacterium]
MSGSDVDLEFDVADLVAVLGEPTSLSNPDLLDYWFEYRRSDDVTVTLSLSGYQRSVAVIVRVSESVVACSVRIDRCDAVRVLESARRTLEVVSSDPSARCFIALDGETIVVATVP